MPTKWRVFRPRPVESNADTVGVRRDGSVDYSLDTLPERVANYRRENFPVITADEDEWIARRKGQPRRIVRHSCGKQVFIGKVCHGFPLVCDDDQPTKPPTESERLRDWNEFRAKLGQPPELPPIAETHTTKARDDAKRAAQNRAARKR